MSSTSSGRAGAPPARGVSPWSRRGRSVASGCVRLAVSLTRRAGRRWSVHAREFAGTGIGSGWVDHSLAARGRLRLLIECQRIDPGHAREAGESVSADTTGTPCSMARAASCASVTRFPRRSSRWSTVPPERRRCARQRSGSSTPVRQANRFTTARRRLNSAVRENTRGCVAIRRNAPIVCQGIAMRRLALEVRSHPDPLNWRGAGNCCPPSRAAHSRQEARAPLSGPVRLVQQFEHLGDVGQVDERSHVAGRMLIDIVRTPRAEAKPARPAHSRPRTGRDRVRAGASRLRSRRRPRD